MYMWWREVGEGRAAGGRCRGGTSGFSACLGLHEAACSAAKRLAQPQGLIRSTIG